MAVLHPGRAVLLCIASLALTQAFLLTDGSSCQSRCDHIVDHTKSCQCNSHCHTYNDCCADYNALCVTSRGSCVGKCQSGYDPSLPCQCNTQCPSHNNCCNDFNSLCQAHSPTAGGQTCSSFTDVTEELWENDVNRLSSNMYAVDLQGRVSLSQNIDHAAHPFFQRVDASALSARPTFQAFLALQDNYNPASGTRDPVTSDDSREISHFLDLVLQTPVMSTLLKYLQCKGLVHSQSELRQKLTELWFTTYARHHGGQVDSSGFEHIMVGEFKSSHEVNGLHSWLAYYHKESAAHINYHGYVKQAQPNLVDIQFEWSGHSKAGASFFLATSPEFDMALYSLCALTGQRSVRLGGHAVSVHLFLTGHHIASAFPSF